MLKCSLQGLCEDWNRIYVVHAILCTLIVQEIFELSCI